MALRTDQSLLPMVSVIMSPAYDRKKKKRRNSSTASSISLVLQHTDDSGLLQYRMSTSKIVPLRAMHGRCLHRLPTGIASLTVASRSSRLVASAALLVSPSWQRHQSTSRDQERRQDSSTSKQQKITFRQFAGRALGAGLRNLAFALSPKGIRQAYRDSPGSTSFAVFLQVPFPSYINL